MELAAANIAIMLDFSLSTDAIARAGKAGESPAAWEASWYHPQGEERLPSRLLTHILAVADQGMQEKYDKAYTWLFERSPQVLWAADQDLDRYCFKMSSADCGALLWHRGKEVGVVTVWKTLDHPATFTGRKDLFDSVLSDEEVWKELESLGFPPIVGMLDKRVCTGFREYPFTALTLPTGNLATYTQDIKSDIGEFFTGNWEDEDDDTRASYLGQNISRRKYERLFIRWTDALALYARDWNKEDVREVTRLRAAVLYEYCILVRMMLRHDSAEFTNIAQAPTHSYFPFSMNVRQANARLSSFSNVEYRYVTAPRIKSIEASQLVEDSMKCFGVRDLIADLRESYRLAQERLSSIRQQWLLIAGLIAFVAPLVVTVIFRK